VIAHGIFSVTAVEVGGGLRSFRAGDTEILDGYAVNEMCHDARGDVLMPWPNRTAGGSYSFESQTQQLPINETTQNNAIHGLVRWANWSVSAQSGTSVTLAHSLYPQPGYPFALSLEMQYALSDTGLSVLMRARNAGSSPCPFGAGQHPYITLGPGLINAMSLIIPADSMYRYDQQLVPVEKISVQGTDLDFRAARMVDSTVINMDYTDLRRDHDGRARVVAHSEHLGQTVAVWMDGAFHHVTVYTGETVQPPERRRHGLAVEPMTCPPNALNTGDDLLVLAPGEEWTGAWGIEVHGF
jgi:aldose 1-epimerase